jgi:hypothetical protein
MHPVTIIKISGSVKQRSAVKGAGHSRLKPRFIIVLLLMYLKDWA